MPVYNDIEIDNIKAAGQIVAQVHQLLRDNAKEGTPTEYLDKIAEEHIRSSGATPSFKGYRGYPASICTSINEEVVHGIPSKRKLDSGDLLKLDVGVYLNGFHADAGFSMGIGQVSPERTKLMQVARDAFYRGLQFVRTGNTIQSVGRAIAEYVHQHDCEVVRQLVGHGVGSHLHEDPEIPNFDRGGNPVTIQAGMVLAIEPMVNAGTWKVKTAKDKWTILTADKKDSAYYEHTVVVTDDGPVIATA